MKTILSFFKKHWKPVLGLILALFIGFRVVRASNLPVVGKNRNVETTNPATETLQKTLSVSGQIEATKHATLKFKVVDRLVSLNVEEGQQVKQGQTLAATDTSNAKTAADNAYRTWLSADASAKKAEDDVKGNDDDESFEERETRVSAQTARDSAYFNWQQSQKDLVDTLLTSPFDGLVANINNLFVGSNISADSYIEVVDPDTLYFSAEIDEVDINGLAVGQKATIYLDAFPDEPIESTITHLSFAPLSDTTGTSYEAHLALKPESNLKYRLGLNGEAEIIVATKPDILTIPFETLIDYDTTVAKVQLLKGGAIEEKEITIGLTTDDRVEVVSGLSLSDNVVIPSDE